MRPSVDRYQPSDEVLNFAAKLHVVGVIGPVAAGKNTLMAASGLAIAGAETSREPRPGETSYRRYYDFTNSADRDEVRINILQGRYLQIAAHPASGEFYTSLPEHYDDSSPNLMDVTAVEYRRMQQAKLVGNLSAVYIVPSTYDEWRERWYGRDGEVDTHTLVSRTREAHDSIVACLGDPNIPFLVNNDIDESAQRFRELAMGDTLSNGEHTLGRVVAQQLVVSIRHSGLLELAPTK